MYRDAARLTASEPGFPYFMVASYVAKEAGQIVFRCNIKTRLDRLHKEINPNVTKSQVSNDQQPAQTTLCLVN